MLALCALAVGGCASDDGIGSQAKAPATARLVRVALRDYGFDVPPLVAKGRVVLEASNMGDVVHELILVRSKEQEGSTTTVAGDKMRGGGVRLLGYIPPTKPGGRGVFAVDVSPGLYTLACYVTDPDGRSHAAQGMKAEFSVR